MERLLFRDRVKPWPRCHRLRYPCNIRSEYAMLAPVCLGAIRSVTAIFWEHHREASAGRFHLVVPSGAGAE